MHGIMNIEFTSQYLVKVTYYEMKYDFFVTLLSLSLSLSQVLTHNYSRINSVKTQQIYCQL